MKLKISSGVGIWYSDASLVGAWRIELGNKFGSINL